MNAVTVLVQLFPARLERLLDDDTDAGYLSSRLLDNSRQADRRITIGKKVVNDKHPILR